MEGVNKVARLRMLDAEFQPRSESCCVMCLCSTGLVCVFSVNLVDGASFGICAVLWRVSSGCCLFLF